MTTAAIIETNAVTDSARIRPIMPVDWLPGSVASLSGRPSWRSWTMFPAPMRAAVNA